MKAGPEAPRPVKAHDSEDLAGNLQVVHSGMLPAADRGHAGTDEARGVGHGAHDRNLVRQVLVHLGRSDPSGDRNQNLALMEL